HLALWTQASVDLDGWPANGGGPALHVASDEYPALVHWLLFCRALLQHRPGDARRDDPRPGPGEPAWDGFRHLRSCHRPGRHPGSNSCRPDLQVRSDERLRGHVPDRALDHHSVRAVPARQGPPEGLHACFPPRGVSQDFLGESAYVSGFRLALDVASGTLALVSAKDLPNEMGIINIATTRPHSVAPVLAGCILARTHSDSFSYTAATIFVLLGTLTVMPIRAVR